MAERKPLLLLSDLDDTIKISHTSSAIRTVMRGLFTHHAYVGMAELYRAWIRPLDQFWVVSSSPKMIRPLVQNFLTRHRFPTAQIHLRDWIRQKDIRNYKGSTIPEITKQWSGDLILIGDDTEWDPEVFSDFAAIQPGRVTAIYIRRMRGRPLPEGVIGFHTAYEVAVAELRAGRITAEQALEVGQAVASAGDLDNVIPYFAFIPEKLALPEIPGLEAITSRIVERLKWIYDKRERLKRVL